MVIAIGIDFLTIEIEGDFTYELVTINGAVILKGSGSDKEIIEMNMLSDGVYFITIHAKNTIDKLKVVKQ